METSSPSEGVAGQRVPAAEAEGLSSACLSQCLLHNTLAQQLYQLAKA